MPGRGKLGTSHTAHRHLSTGPGLANQQVRPQDNELGGGREKQRGPGTQALAHHPSAPWIPSSVAGDQVVQAWLTAAWQTGMSRSREAAKSPSQAQNSDGPEPAGGAGRWSETGVLKLERFASDPSSPSPGWATWGVSHVPSGCRLSGS